MSTIALVILGGAVSGYFVYQAAVAGLLKSLPDSNEDFVFTGVGIAGGGDCARNAVPGERIAVGLAVNQA